MTIAKLEPAPMGKLYFHYKNKPYKYLVTVKHSETLEDLALYETLYENKLGKLWVRPKDMFFETVVIGGRERPRFEATSIDIETFDRIGENEIESLERVHLGIFSENFRERISKHLKQHSTFHLAIARIRGEVVGYKFGFALSDKMFYSCLGGVAAKWRGVGVASQLMEAQHDWCRTAGFKGIQTHTYNKFSAMIALNLRHGFNIVGALTTDAGKPKLILQKLLN